MMIVSILMMALFSIISSLFLLGVFNFSLTFLDNNFLVVSKNVHYDYYEDTEISI